MIEELLRHLGEDSYTSDEWVEKWRNIKRKIRSFGIPTAVVLTLFSSL